MTLASPWSTEVGRVALVGAHRGRDAAGRHVARGSRPPVRRPAASRRACGHLLVILLVVVLTQRLAVPVGGSQIPLTIPLLLVVVGHGLLTRRLALDAARTRLYALGVGSLVALTVVALAREQSPSLLSVLLAVAIYVPAAVSAAGLPRADVDRVLDVFVGLMVVMSLVGLAQLAVQYAGVPGEDWLGRVVPAPFLLEGYNTGDPIVWGSPIVRVNGLVFLEPSFLSFFLGLAVVVAVHRCHHTAVVGLLLLGIVPTSAGNGVVMVLAGVVGLALGPGRGRLRTLVVPAAAAVALALVTPFGRRYAERVTEFGVSGSSSSLRFVQPYEQFPPVWLDDPVAALVGHGAGSGTELTRADEITGLLVPAIPKLLLEYGTVGTILFLVFFLWSLLAGSGERPWTLAILVSYFVLNAALLQVTLAATAILFVHLLRGVPPGPRPAGGSVPCAPEPELRHAGLPATDHDRGR